MPDYAQPRMKLVTCISIEPCDLWYVLLTCQVLAFGRTTMMDTSAFWVLTWCQEVCLSLQVSRLQLRQGVAKDGVFYIYSWLPCSWWQIKLKMWNFEIFDPTWKYNYIGMNIDILLHTLNCRYRLYRRLGAAYIGQIPCMFAHHAVCLINSIGNRPNA